MEYIDTHKEHEPQDWLRLIQDRCEYQQFGLRHPEQYALEDNPYANDYRATLDKIADLAAAAIQDYDRTHTGASVSSPG